MECKVALKTTRDSAQSVFLPNRFFCPIGVVVESLRLLQGVRNLDRFHRFHAYCYAPSRVGGTRSGSGGRV